MTDATQHALTRNEAGGERWATSLSFPPGRRQPRPMTGEQIVAQMQPAPRVVLGPVPCRACYLPVVLSSEIDATSAPWADPDDLTKPHACPVVAARPTGAILATDAYRAELREAQRRRVQALLSGPVPRDGLDVTLRYGEHAARRYAQGIQDQAPVVQVAARTLATKAAEDLAIARTWRIDAWRRRSRWQRFLDWLLREPAP